MRTRSKRERPPSRVSRGAALALAAAWLTAACALVDDTLTRRDVAEPKQEDAAKPAADNDTGRDTARHAPEWAPVAPLPPRSATVSEPPAAPERAARRDARLTPAEPALNDDPERLIGLDGAAVAALLGWPGFLRDEPPAQVWQYRSERCILDVFLYADGPAGPRRVVYYEIRGDGLDGTGRRRCFRALLLAHERG